MASNYFVRVNQATLTRAWVNNPTIDEAKSAINVDVFCATSNPTYVSRMLKLDSEQANAVKVIDEVIKTTDDNHTAANLVQQKLVGQLAETFMPVYKKSGGKYGFVAIQGNPYFDTNADYIIEEALAYRKIAENIVVKMPATFAGLKAVEVLVSRNIPLISTQGLAVAHTTQVLDAYNRGAAKGGHTPPFWATTLAGIFDEFSGKYVKKHKIDIAPEVLKQAGCLISRKLYNLCRERYPHGTLMGGGVRDFTHFTEMVGGDIHVTCNLNFIEQMIKADLPVVARIDAPIDPKVVDELCRKLPDFRKAWDEDGLKTEDFATFAPFIYFRNVFVSAWDYTIGVINERRSLV